MSAFGGPAGALAKCSFRGFASPSEDVLARACDEYDYWLDFGKSGVLRSAVRGRALDISLLEWRGELDGERVVASQGAAEWGHRTPGEPWYDLTLSSH